MSLARPGRFFRIACAAAALAAGAGCGRPRPVPVKGTVTLDGKPLSGATVAFSPLDPAGHAATGATADDGSFRLTTYEPGDGALPGEYKVIVVQEPGLVLHVERPAGETHKGMMMALNRKKSPQGRAQLAKEKKKLPPSLVPARYRDPAETPLREMVPPRGPVRLELQSIVPSP